MNDTGRGTVADYSQSGRSAFYPDSAAPKAMTCKEAFIAATELDPAAASYWLGQLKAVPLRDIEASVEQCPSSCMSPPAKDFACRLLRYNYDQLLRTAP
jgi:hypothetical protein